MQSADTLILGAGAAGLLCAITAAQRGRKVVVLERSNKVGKKILMSGGGRCNFTNLHASPERFLSANPPFCISALSRYTQWDFIELVEQHGIDYFEKETVNGLSGQLFCKESSKQIVAMLLSECERYDIQILDRCETSEVARKDGFHVASDRGKFSAETLVVACGGLSIPSLGGSGFGYQLAEQFGLRLLPTSAGLVPLTFSDARKEMFARLSGLACEVVISNGRASFREDLLFTHRGLSGPAVLQISSYWKPGEPLQVDFLPGKDVGELLARWKTEHPRSLLRTMLASELPAKLVHELEALHWPEFSEKPLAEWQDRRLAQVAGQLQAWDLKPAGTEGYRTAEVTLGGVDTRDLSSQTMESPVPGLFFIGEVIDVTGHLGGFNFQWAWSSGYAAGLAL
ncbi:MAG: NAD(P)/FAD-dependent oxidoreductase [Xanthomonadales bacterium]|nr:NAD(P)/FAD-dependent oxidoreductase [Gammaproteobacteria bacterium]MBT8052905.1 NAD(P)/FAD-dependent oxidoreductase [Gammaproteobacteria bacterium]NND56188.1 NAD(P)/FAD-dependent oxidoreductase [Xanthomonadales bacterium]NNK51566.1 NAD(P)/FAD-dependent oxidoreductase [Xanthomonadales bacterium]